MQMNQAITFLSDGGDTVRNLPNYLNPRAEHLLDWFHVTMRLTVMGLMAKGVGASSAELDAANLHEEIDRVKWNLWNGNPRKALEIVDELEGDLDIDEVQCCDKRRKLLKTVPDLESRAGGAGVAAPGVSGRDVGHHQHDTHLRVGSERQAVRGACALRELAHKHFCVCAAGTGTAGAVRIRWPDQRHHLSRLGRAGLGPRATGGRHRGDGQPGLAQG